VVTDTQWKVFCESFGLTELFNDPELKTNPQRVVVTAAHSAHRH